MLFVKKSFVKNFYYIDLNFLLFYHFNRARSYSKNMRRNDKKCITQDLKIVIMKLVINGAIAGFLLKQAGLSVDIEKLENILNNFGLVALILLSCLMYFISYKISYKIYKNKEE